MSIILTSFKCSKSFKGEKFSVARWQPKGFNYRTLNFLSAVDIYGNPLHLSRFKTNPLQEYKKQWFGGIWHRNRFIKQWLESLKNEEDLVLCCWYPYSQPTQEQIKLYGTFACHTGLIGQLVKRERKDIEIVLDQDRHNQLVTEWRP